MPQKNPAATLAHVRRIHEQGFHARAMQGQKAYGSCVLFENPNFQPTDNLVAYDGRQTLHIVQCEKGVGCHHGAVP